MDIRTQKVFKVFGRFYGVKYLFIYWLHRNCYIKIIGKRVVKLKYKGHTINVRLFSRDLDFIEAIYIGRLQGGYLQGEYDLREDGKCDSFLDLGANIGLFTVMYGIKYPDRCIVAVEPEKNNFRLLKKNTKDLKNVICINKAIWYKKAMVKVYESNCLVYPSNTPSEGGFFVGECSEKDEEGIRAITINSIVKKYGLSNFLCKMDIEGAEYSVFEKGKCNWLDKCKTLVMETHDRFNEQNDENRIFQIVEKSHKLKKVLGENKVFVSVKNSNI